MANQDSNSSQAPDQAQKSEVVFAWQYPEYIKYKKNIWWYVISGLILVLGVLWSIIDHNYLFMIILILVYLLILILENREPEIIDFIITPDGLKSGRHFHYYRDIDHFYLIYQDTGLKNLYFEFKNPLRPRLIIPLQDQDAVSIREYLLNFLDEDLEREAEPIIERLRRFLRF